MTVALIKRDNYTNPIKSAIELCSGFNALKPDCSVLIKPNLVMGADKNTIPPFGKVPTASAIEYLIQALLDHNCRKVTIGEGAIVNPEFGSDTASAMKFSGIDRIGNKYGIKLEDFESSPFKKIKINGPVLQMGLHEKQML